MSKLDVVKNVATGLAGRTSLYGMKYGPDILVAVGVVGVVVSTVMACKATLKVDQAMKESQELFDRIEEGKKTIDPSCYTEKDYKRDLTIAFVKRAVSIGKLYLPAASVGLLSIGAILGSHRILSQRNIALAAAYKVVSESYKNYRRNVVEEYGIEKDESYLYGKKVEVETTIENEDGTTKKNVVKYRDLNGLSPYSRIFDEANSRQYKRSNTLNKATITTVQNYMNDMLKIRGHVFLNEVYDALGFQRSKEGAVVGWINNQRQGDGYIDFDLEKPRNADFMRGIEDVAILDFNVDGTILNYI